MTDEAQAHSQPESAKKQRESGNQRTAWEVEQKYRVSDREALRSNLKSNGFVKSGDERHRDVYFRHPCRDFRQTGEAFRLRELNDLRYVTYKGPRLRSEIKTRPEMELLLQTDEYEEWQSLLERLGFQALPAVEKQRAVYQPVGHADHGSLSVTLDEVVELGCFAELEIIAQGQEEIVSAQRCIEQQGRALGLTQVEPLSYLAQLLVKLGLE